MILQLLILLLVLILTILPGLFVLMTLNLAEWKLFRSYVCNQTFLLKRKV